jgi:hypothetical protein
VLPALEGLASLLAATKAIEDLDIGASERGLTPRPGRQTAPPRLRDLARRHEEEADYARRHAVRVHRFDLVPLIDRLSESAAARLAKRLGERHDPDRAGRFRQDAERLRRALLRGA